MENQIKEKKSPSALFSILVFVGILAILSIGIAVLKIDVVSLMVVCLLAVFCVSMTFGYSVGELFEAMAEALKNAAVSLLFFIIIGMIVASWITSGTVPTLIYYGLKFITPGMFLPLGFIACCITSFVTGTSWGTAGTIGVVLLGMGSGMGIPAPVIAGMAISGAMFGDYLSPMSDTTILSSQGAGIDIYRHVKSMLLTIIPAAIVVTIIYAVMGAGYDNAYDATATNEILATMESTFNLSILTLIPIVLVLVMSALKFPSVPVLILGVLVGGVIAMICQGTSLAEFLNNLNYGFSAVTGNASVDTLVNRGGIQGMMWTFSLAFIALMLSGILEKVGYLRAIAEMFIEKIKRTGTLVVATYVTGVMGCMAMAEVYLSIILNTSLYKKAYKDKGVDLAVLSRTAEEGATLCGACIPWTTSAAFMAGTFGVATLEYLPYTLITFVAPAISIICAYVGIAIYKNKCNNED